MQIFYNAMSSISEDLQSARYQKMDNGKDYEAVPNEKWRRTGLSRLKNLACFPVEFIASLENVIALSFQGVGFIMKGFVAKPLRALRPNSERIKRFNNSLPGVKEIASTAAKALGYFAGSIATLTLGMASPAANIWLHKKVHLYSGVSSKEKMDAELQRIAKVKKIVEDNQKIQELLSGKNYVELAQKQIDIFNETIGKPSSPATGSELLGSASFTFVEKEVEAPGSFIESKQIAPQGSVAAEEPKQEEISVAAAPAADKKIEEDPFYALDHEDEFKVQEQSYFQMIRNWYYGN